MKLLRPEDRKAGQERPGRPSGASGPARERNDDALYQGPENDAPRSAAGFDLACGHWTDYYAQEAHRLWKTGRQIFFCETCNHWGPAATTPPTSAPKTPMF